MLLKRSLDCFRVPLSVLACFCHECGQELLRVSVEAVAGAALKCAVLVSLQNGIIAKLKEY